MVIRGTWEYILYIKTCMYIHIPGSETLLSNTWCYWPSTIVKDIVAFKCLTWLLNRTLHSSIHSLGHNIFTTTTTTQLTILQWEAYYIIITWVIPIHVCSKEVVFIILPSAMHTQSNHRCSSGGRNIVLVWGHHVILTQTLPVCCPLYTAVCSHIPIWPIIASIHVSLRSGVELRMLMNMTKWSYPCYWIRRSVAMHAI